MARGNWQRRVEMTEARRKEAKQRKQKVADIRSYKQYSADLVDYCYNRMAAQTEDTSLCLFVDKKPHHVPSLPDAATADVHEDDDSELDDDLLLKTMSTTKQQRGRGRSNSTASDHGGGKGNSGGTPAKKVHPRSRKNSITKEEDVVVMTTDGHQAIDSDLPVVMCRAHFFTAKCTVKQCGYPHLTKMYGQVKKECLDDLVASFATATASVEQQLLYMPALYCLQLSHISELYGGGGGGGGSTTSTTIKASDIVYAVDAQKTLLYDRHREGMLVGKKIKSVASLSTSTTSTAMIKPPPDGSGAAAKLLPGLLLRYVVEYLADDAVAHMSAVCHDWHQALSPHNRPFWQFLLTRNQWPGDSYDDYVAHASVVRDMTSLQQQQQLQQGYHHHNHHHSNNDDDEAAAASIVLVAEWQPHQVLVIDSAASAVLYDGSIGPPRPPKVLLKANLDPYSHTKKRTITVTAAALDDTTIGLLAQVRSVHVETITSILILKQRDAFLLNDDDDNDEDGENGTHVIDIHEALLHYLLSLDVADHRMLQLMDFLQSHAFGEVQIVASPALAACGHGRFLIHVHIWIPTNVPGMDPAMMMMIDRRLVLFSADAVLWMGDSDDHHVHSLQYEPGHPHGRVAVGSDAGIVVAQLLDGAPPTRIDTKGVRHALLTRTHIVGYSNSQLTPTSVQATELRFHRRLDVDGDDNDLAQPPVDPAPAPHVLKLPIDTGIADISCVHGDHLVVLCRELALNPAVVNNVHAIFLPRNEGATLRALIYHVPTQVMIRSIELSMRQQLRMMDHVQQTMALCGDNGDIWMSGIDVLDARAEHEANHHQHQHHNNNSSAKKKKKRKPQRGGKKDGFARGMSLRG